MPRTRWLIGGAVLGAALAAAVVATLVLRAGHGAPAVADATDPGPVHVHGLGVNPGDEALYIATHTGLWRLPPGRGRPERVGDSRQDTMGFTVAGRDRFLGSGHPDNVRLPPLLGLIESNDRGKSWNPISLLGEADFHVLRAAGRRVYGYDVTHERLLVSDDAGRTWTERRAPAPVLDLVPDASDPDHLVASTAKGLFRSRDAGARWRAAGAELGLLAWPAPNVLYLVAGTGDVFRSEDGGRGWNRVGALGGEPAALLAVGTEELYAAVHDGRILSSRDGGRTWHALNT